ncbi:GGDEF domain-containing protein [Sporolactobacillus sp. THM19-2]|jgi:diguanylate cyclase (GGDEF)-like protein/PAS domain S-box-containing protein|uniref:GGDEF domain-containing protein n=1 Tax=Sporolactobacillus sp. THM19-2 TaxID=2511171 RepID=UPI00102022D9|nr:diguanylate cyclase [Sporolactobacillus sp. THM19-2]RYL92378.1 sensor domain-containing diguanylate cyclase [Sporolactobacillus sp. THM19-2]
MITLDSVLPGVLHCINEGVVILSNDREILCWNPFMEKITGMQASETLGRPLEDVLPQMNNNFFHEAIRNLIHNGTPAFFSAAMHKHLINRERKVNLKMDRVAYHEGPAIFLEFTDVTHQFLRISQLHQYVTQLSRLNDELRRKEAVIKKLAYYDRLTGVANRALFDKYAGRYLNEAKETGRMLGLMFIDVNEFKSINDTYGHNTGDKVMTRVASLLTQSTRKNDIVCRYGGDEFVVLLPGIHDDENDHEIIDGIKRNKHRKIMQDGYEIHLSLSIGISFYPEDGESIDELIERADCRMYQDKHESK